MSGIYIKSMEMPTSCLECDWCAHTIPADNYICYRLNRAVIGVAKEDVDESINVCCPLVPVPPHGRLIDADALASRIKEEGRNQAEYYADRYAPVVMAYGDCYGKVESAPTIIEAEEGET